MAAMVYIEHAGMSYVFENKDGMEPKMFHDRCWFVVKHKERDVLGTSRLEELADIWVHKKHYGLVYPPSVEGALSALQGTR